MSNQSPATRDRQLSPTERRELARLVAEHGEPAIRAQLGLGKLSVARLVAGLPVLRATLTVTRAGLAELAKKETAK